MKKLFLIAALMVATLSANAQQMFIKPMVGGQLTTLTGDGVQNTKMKFGLVAGAEFGYNFSEQLGLTAGLLYSMEGSGVKNSDDKWKTDYLNIPVLLNFYAAPGFAIKAGVQPGFLMSAKAGDTDMKDYLNKFDFSIPLGLSYEISDFVIDARYNLGLSNILKDDKGVHWDAKAKNSVIMLTVGYKIPF